MKKIFKILTGTVLLCFLGVSGAIASPQNETEQFATDQNLSVEVVDALMDSGYHFDEIQQMTIEEMDNILQSRGYYSGSAIVNGKIVIPTMYASPIPGCTFVASVPFGGGNDEWFHPEADTTEDNISEIVYTAGTLAQDIFGKNILLLDYSYYLYGEWGETGALANAYHEGIDMKLSNGQDAAVYSPVNGTVCRVTTTGMNITFGDYTLNIQHVTPVDGLQVGDTITRGSLIGTEDTSESHVHAQICQTKSCTAIHSGRNTTMECIRPYQVISLMQYS